MGTIPEQTDKSVVDGTEWLAAADGLFDRKLLMSKVRQYVLAAAAGGNDTELQFNNAGGFGGAKITYNSATKTLSLEYLESLVTGVVRASSTGLLSKLDYEDDINKFFASDGVWRTITTSSGDFFDAVIAMQYNNTLDPSTATGARYIILDTANIHANFKGSYLDIAAWIAGETVANNDIVSYDGTDFVVVLDASARVQPATVTVGTDKNGNSNHQWTYNVTDAIWVDRGATAEHNSLAGLNAGNYQHLTTDQVEALWTKVVANIRRNGSVGININPEFTLDVLGQGRFGTGDDKIILGFDMYGGELGILDPDDVAIAVKYDTYYQYGQIPGVTNQGLFINNGSVGIKKHNPAYTLDVNGDVNVATGSMYKINGVDLKFLNLGDTPANYTSAAYKRVRVNSGATGLEYEPTQTPQALTVSSNTLTWNVANGYNARVTLGANVTTFTFSGAIAGDSGVITVIQDATGGRTMVLPVGHLKEGGVLTLSIAGNAKDVLGWYYDGTNYFWNIGKAFA